MRTCRFGVTSIPGAAAAAAAAAAAPTAAAAAAAGLERLMLSDSEPFRKPARGTAFHQTLIIFTTGEFCDRKYLQATQSKQRR